MARRAGTVSSTGLSIAFSTLGDASSGRNASTGSSSLSLPSSTSMSVAAAITGLVIEAMRKMVSRLIEGPPNDRVPTASTCTSPCRLTSATTPGMSPDATGAAKA